MANETTTSSLSDSLDVMVMSARTVREYDGVMPQLVERQDLPEGKGTSWKEITLNQLTATAVTETTKLNNPQQVTDTAFTLTPTIVGIHMVLTDRVQRRISKLAFAQIGKLGQEAIQRKKDKDGLLLLDGFTSLSGAGTTLSSGIISAAQARIAGNSTEGAPPPYYAVLHQYQIKDLADELVGGVGTTTVPEGPTAQVFKQGFRLPIAGVDVYPDNNITIDSADDAKGGVFAKKGIVLVQGKTPWKETRREPDLGGGADSVFLYDEFVYGERLGAGTTSAFGFEVYSDATSPTS